MSYFKNKKILIISPHPDDEVFGCGGLIHRCKREGGEVYVLYLTVGTTKDFSAKGISTLDERMNEVEKVVKFLKIDVEGFELEVLEGAKNLLSSSNAPIICVEYFIEREKDEKNTIYNFIKMINDYSFYQLCKTSHTISKLKPVSHSKDLNPHDNLYCFTNLHLEQIPKELFDA